MYLKSLTELFTLVMDIVDETVKFVRCESKQSTCPGLVFLFLQAIRNQRNELFEIVFIPVIILSSDWDHSDPFFLVHG